MIDDEVTFADSDDFRGINPEIWIDYCVKACLRDARINPAAFVNDVLALEVLLKTDIERRPDFNVKLENAIRNADKMTMKPLGFSEVAFIKFEHLMALIKSKTIEQVSLDL